MLAVACIRSIGRYEKYVVIQASESFVGGSEPDYDAATTDFNGARMYGLPVANSLQRFSFCAVPGEYMIHSIDTAGDGWYGGGTYTVMVDGTIVIQEEMTSPSIQSTTFDVVLPTSARTHFAENKALRGGGGAIFWETIPPRNSERYRNQSDPNTAIYGAFAATPARTLAATGTSYDAISGVSMVTDPITVQITDRCEITCLPPRILLYHS